MSCPDTTALIDLTLVLGDRPEEALRHVIDCPDCRSVLGAAARIRHLHAGEPVRPGFTDGVVQALGRQGTETAESDRGRGLGRAAWWAAHVVLVGATAFMTSVLAGTTAQIRPGPRAVAISILAGAAITILQHRDRNRRSLPDAPSSIQSGLS